MEIIHMIDDYEVMSNDKKEIGGFEAYKNYTLKYEDLFSSLLSNVYMMELEDLKMLVNSINFTSKLQVAREYYSNGIVDLVVNQVESIARLLDFEEDFDLYLGLDLGKVEEFSARYKGTKPFIYIGLDREIDEEYIETVMKDEITNMLKLHLS